MRDIAAILGALGAAPPRRRPKHVPSTELPKLHERNYAKLIQRRVLSPMRVIIERDLIGSLSKLVPEPAGDSMVVDRNPEADLLRVIAGMKVKLARVVNDAELAELVRRNVVSGVMVANGQLNRNQLRVLLGVDILGADPALSKLAQGFVRENVALIKSIPERRFAKLRTMVLENVRAGRRADVIEREIRKKLPEDSRHAELIARDQTAKLNGRITRARHEALGLTQYVWRTSQDDRVRTGHAALEGRTFSYDDPPVVDEETGRHDNPGGDYQCRCVAEPVLPGIEG